MPAVGEQTGRPASVPSRPTPRRPAPRPRPAPPRTTGTAFQPVAAAKPFQAQQQAAQQKTDRARARLPKTTFAAPPVISTPRQRASTPPLGVPTGGQDAREANLPGRLGGLAPHPDDPKRVQAAKAQLVKSLRAAVGTYGTGQQRLARIDALLRDIRTQPRYAATRKSIAYWTAAERRLVTPGRAAMNARDRATPGRAPTRARLGIGPVSLATVNLTAASRGLGSAIAAAAPGLQSGSAPARLVRNSFKDLGILGKAPFIGGYEAGNAIVSDVAHLATHPTALAHGYQSKSAKLLGGILAGTAEEVKHPGKAISEHPVLTLLDVAGVASVAGRTAGAAGRRMGKSSTVRPPLAMTDDAGQPAIVQRTYSKDEGRRQVQKHQDSKREPLTDAKGNPVTIKDRGRDVPVFKSTAAEKERFARQRGDFVASRGNLTERQVRDQQTKESRVRGVKGRAAKDIVAMAVEGTIRTAKTFADDLKTERKRIATRIAAHNDGSKPFRDSGDLEAASNRLKLVDRVLSNPKAMTQGPRIVAEAERHGAKLNAGDVASADAKIIDPLAARRSALSVTALQHMGARHFTVEEHAALEREAGKAEKAAIDRYVGTQGRQVMYHVVRDTAVSSATKLKAIERGGLKPSSNGHVYLYDDLAQAKEFAKGGGKILEVNVRGLDVGGHSGAATRTVRGGIPADRIVRPGDREAALADLNAAREHRIAVSGREPDALRKHENAKAAHVAATSRAKAATEAEAKAKARVSNLAAQHKSERGREAHHGPVAAYHVGGKRFVLLKDAAAWAKANGHRASEIKRVATTPGEAKRVGQLSQARRALKAATARRRAAQKTVRVTERGAKDNPLPPAREALRYGEDNPAGKPAGAYLSNTDIEDFLKASGRDPGTVAYLPHRQDVIGNRAHHAQMRPGQRPLLDAGETRTGKAYLDAVTESSQRLLHDQGVRQAVQLNKAKQLDKLVEDHGLRHPAWAKAQRGEPLTKGEQRIVDKGGLFSANEADELARRAFNDTGERLTPMRAYQAKLDPETKRVIREDLQGPGGMDGLSQRLLNDRIVKPDDGIDPRARNVVLVPTGLVDRLNKHLTPAGEIERFFQYLNRPFRMAVLPQPRWLFGNFAESFIVRLPLAGSGLVNIPGLLVDLTAARRVIRELENGSPEMKAAAEAIKAQQTGSGLFIGNRGANVHRTAAESMPEFAQQAYGRMVAKLPAVDQMVELGRSAIHWIVAPLRMFFEFNRLGIENPAQRAAFGNQARKDIQAITGSWIKSITLGRQAAAEAARGLVDTPTQQRFMHAQYQLLGKYSGMSPTLRAFTQSVAPFLPWALNAARFVYWTMPAHHTATTAFLIQVQNVVAKDWEEIHKNLPPGGLKDAIPVKGGGWLDLERYTPYGLTGPIANGGDLRGITGQFTPQLGGLTNAAQGLDPFGRPLEVQPGPGNPQGKATSMQKFLIGGYDLLEAITPYLSTGRRLLEHGETAFADSTIASPKTKPGTSHGMPAAERTFSPFRPTYLGPPTSGVKPPAPSKTKPRPSTKPADPWDAVDAAMDAVQQPTGPDPWDAVK